MSRRLGITSDRTVEMQGSSYKHVLQLWQKRLLHTPANTSTEGSQTLAPDKTFRYLMPLILALNRRGRIMHISILALVTGFGFFAYVSLFFGQTSVLLAPRKAPDLARCGDRACFRGLIPYETPWSEAIEQFNGHNQILDDTEYAQIVLLPTSDSTTLASILLDISFDQNLPLAAVLSLYGPPTCIEIYRLHGVVMLHYPSLHLMSQSEMQPVPRELCISGHQSRTLERVRRQLPAILRENHSPSVESNDRLVVARDPAFLPTLAKDSD